MNKKTKNNLASNLEGASTVIKLALENQVENKTMWDGQTPEQALYNIATMLNNLAKSLKEN